MDEKLKPLFTPWRIGNCEIKNRIVLTSMGGTDLFGWMEKNHFDKMGARFLGRLQKTMRVLSFRGVSRYIILCLDNGCTRIKRCMKI